VTSEKGNNLAFLPLATCPFPLVTLLLCGPCGDGTSRKTFSAPAGPGASSYFASSSNSGSCSRHTVMWWSRAWSSALSFQPSAISRSRPASSARWSL